jgi:hypothetical protein
MCGRKEGSRDGRAGEPETEGGRRTSPGKNFGRGTEAEGGIEGFAKDKKEKEEDRLRQEEETEERREREEERKLKLEEIELNKMKMEREDVVLREEVKIREEELQRAKQKDAEEARRLNSSDVKAKRYGDALRGCIAKMPSDPVDILPWFRSVEKIFTDFKVDRELRVHLLKPHMTASAAALVARLDSDVASDFAAVKDAILHEFKLSPSELLHRFTTLVRNKDETFTMHSNRLKSLLLYYLESRKCSTFETLIELLVCDRIKQTLPDAVLRYVLSLENNLDGCWMKLKDLASSLDIYNDSHINEKPRHVMGTMGFGNGWKGNAKAVPPRPPTPKFGFNKGNVNRETREVLPKGGNVGNAKRCFVCNSTNHLANYHSRVNATANAPVGNQGNQSMKGRPLLNAVVKQNNAVGADASARNDVHSSGPVTSSAGSGHDTSLTRETEVKSCEVIVESLFSPFNNFARDGIVSNMCAHNDDGEMENDVCEMNDNRLTSGEADEFKASDLAPLRYVNVQIGDGQSYSSVISALYDTGAEIPLAHPRVLEGLNVQKRGSISIRSAVGESVKCELCKFAVRYDASQDGCAREITVMCAVTDKANEPLILTADVIDRLLSLNCCVIQSVNPNDDDDDGENNEIQPLNDVLNEGVINENAVNETVSPNENVTADSINTNEVKLSASAEKLRQEQLDDDSLNSCRALCEKGKGGFFLKNGILYRHTKIIGRPVDQLVVPKMRRAEVLKLAHETYGAHQSALNTAHRIKYSMWFPSMMKTCKAYVKSCSVCCRRARVTCYDRVPIKSIPRDEISFNHWMCDVAGPFWPNQSKAYNYCFVACDSKTRWPAAFALRSVNAQTICECLLKLWSVFGVSQFVSMDNATYNTAKLTQTMMKCMGSSPIFITPHHSEGNAIAERTIGKLKESIHKMAVEKQNAWPKYLDIILWCWREIPHATLGASPYQLAFGHLPRGPCAILREFWTGEGDLPIDLGKSAAEYLHELRDRLAVADKYATTHLAHAQQQYVSRYNLRSRDKHFDIGDTVLILNPDTSSSRLWSRWRAPATIVDKSGEYSYLVEIDGARQWIHANKLRKFDVRIEEIVCDSFINNECIASVDSCSVIHEKDVDFGDVDAINLHNYDLSLPSQKMDLNKLAHLSEKQRKEFLAVIDKYPEVFSDIPGLCNQVQHEIKVSDDFQPKRLKPYKIPEKLKPQVDREIQELLRLGLIQESTSPMTSPLVCVLKPNGTDIRLVVDYRYVNGYTLLDPVGPCDMLSVIQRIGRSKYITTFDGKSSYWTIPLKPEDRWLTAFLCDAGEFEWTRAAFGLKNSGSSFVRMLNQILHPIRNFAASFVDDCAVYSDTWEDHLRNIDKFLQVVKDSGLTLTLKKSEFAQPEVKFCGQIVGSGIRRIDPERMRSIEEIRQPENKKQVRQVLGLFGWYREYIPRYAEIVCPLTDLTVKGKPNRVKWGEVEQKSLDTLKESLNAAISQPLHIIDWSLPFNIYSDASDATVAGVLSQTDQRGHERPIAFYSKKLNATQRAWSTIEKEAFAVLEALKRFETFVFGYQIHVYSDHNPLSYLTASAPNSAKLLRWSLALQSFNIKFHYKAGKSDAMAVPDCLTRLGPCDDGGGSSQEVG